MNELITHLNILCKGEIIMSKKSKTAGLEQFKMEAAREVGVTLGQGYNGELTDSTSKKDSSFSALYQQPCIQ